MTLKRIYKIIVPYFIADAARIEYVVIHHPDETAEDVRAQIEQHVQRAAALDPCCRPR